MKKQLLIAGLALCGLSAKAQTLVTDTVVMGSGYTNQIWYSLTDDEAATAPKNNWDLGFRIKGSLSSDIIMNHSGGGAIWLYPKSDKSGWASVDTNGLSTWPGMFNMETEWTGALGRYLNPSDPFDLGWGKYDMSTHFVTGDSLYIVRTQAGNYRKLLIKQLASGTYTFVYANLDGTDSATSTLNKSAYPGKNYGYFSLDTKTAADREPASDDWDLVFGQYATGDYAAMGMPGYTVTGVLVNDTLKVAKVKINPTLRPTYSSYAGHSFSDNINGIGYNWKSTSGVIQDSVVYFIRKNNGDIWKLYFTGWTSGVSGNGSAIFAKQLIYSAVSVAEVTASNATVVLSPNPVQYGQSISLVYHFNVPVATAAMQVYDLTGRMVSAAALETAAGLHTQTFNTSSLAAGTYIVNVVAGNERTQQKFIVQ
jgi:hypothetical protein